MGSTSNIPISLTGSNLTLLSYETHNSKFVQLQVHETNQNSFNWNWTSSNQRNLSFSLMPILLLFVLQLFPCFPKSQAYSVLSGSIFPFIVFLKKGIHTWELCEMGQNSQADLDGEGKCVAFVVEVCVQVSPSFALAMNPRKLFPLLPAMSFVYLFSLD